MASNSDSSGGIGILGVLIGALIVAALGYFFLVQKPANTSTIKVEVPKITTPANSK